MGILEDSCVCWSGVCVVRGDLRSGHLGQLTLVTHRPPPAPYIPARRDLEADPVQPPPRRAAHLYRPPRALALGRARTPSTCGRQYTFTV